MSLASAADFFSSDLGEEDGGPTDRLIISTTGVPLTSGYAGMGIFSLTNSEVADLAASGDITSLFAAFQPIGGADNFTNVANPVFFGEEIPGVYFTENFDVTITPDEIGKTLYTLIFNSSSVSTATEFALLMSSSAITTESTNPPVPITYYLIASDSTILAGSDGPPSNAAAGIIGPAVQTIQLVPVPETSSLAMAAAGLAWITSRRRR